MAQSFKDENYLLDFVVKKGHGVKGLVESGISDVPNTFIQPMDHRTQQCLKISDPIDLAKLDGPDHDLVVKAIVKASETIGFFQVVNHGIPLELLDSLNASAYKFFDQPQQAKAKYVQGVSPSPFVKYGTSFLPEKDLALEWRDYLNMVYINDDQALEHWPNECKKDAFSYLKSSSRLVKRLNEILLQNIGFPYDDIDVHFPTVPVAVNMNYYPACHNPDLTIGVKGHSDIGVLTVLLQDGIGGLQVKLEEDLVDQGLKKDEWIEIAPVSGGLVINIGDTFQIISNGQYKSAEHRVRTSKTEKRISVPLFISPKLEKIAPLPHLVERDGVCRYRETVFADYLQNFFQNAHKGKNLSLDFAKIDYSA